MRLVRINESSRELNELFGKKKKKANSKKSDKFPQVERNAYKIQDIKKWLGYAKKYGSVKLADTCKSLNIADKVTLKDGVIAVALYFNSNNYQYLAVIKNPGPSGPGGIWILDGVGPGEKFSDIQKEFLKCGEMHTVDIVLNRYRFKNWKI